MSDTSQGPGWWLASDGRWYPPETHPDARQAVAPSAPPSAPQPTSPPSAWPSAGVGSGAGSAAGGWQPPSPTGQPPSPASGPPHLYPHYPVQPGAPAPYVYPARRSAATGLSGTIQGFCWAGAGLAAIAAVLGVVALGAFNRYWDTPINSRVERAAYDDWLTLDDAFNGVSGLTWLCGLVVWILLMIWMNQAHKATQQLWWAPRQWGSGWTVGGWFIPAANAVIPFLVMTEIEKLALAPRGADGLVDPTWKQRRGLAVGKAWWVLLVAGMVTYGIGDAIGTAEDAGAGDIQAGYVLMSVGFALLAAACVCGARYVRRVAARVSPAGIAEIP